MKYFRQTPVFFGAVVGIVAVSGYYGLSFLQTDTYSAENKLSAAVAEPVVDEKISAEKVVEKPALPPVMHIATPESVKAIYMTQCVAGTPSWRERLTKLIDDTELNSVVVDIKDYSGTISFKPETPILTENGGVGCRTTDMRKFVAELHGRNIYVIGRVTVFQDPYYTKAHPDQAVKKLSDGTVWKDRKGLSFVDVGSKKYWDYVVALAKESYDIGFDEINFDYVRFPSDGDMKDIDFTLSGGHSKAEALRIFFDHLHSELAPTGMVMSADLFGMTTTNTDDLNIGQVLENALPYFDFIDPMVYPSHYPTGFNGYKDVNAHPYDIVKFSLDRAVERAKASTTTTHLSGSEIVSMATGTKPTLYSKPIYPISKIRPWLQDFDYPVPYTSDMVRAQIKATYDAGLTSWLMWDPGNKYTREALDSK